MTIKKLAYIFALFYLLLYSCTTHKISTRLEYINEVKLLEESKALRIHLLGEAAERKAEFSGLCWYKDNLILLPQYPNNFMGDLGKIFFIKKEIIESFISGKDNSPILPDHYSINLNSLEDLFTLGSGFESITINNDTVYFTIESMNEGQTETILISGEIDSSNKTIILDSNSIVRDPSELFIHNISDESILFHKNRILPIYEVYGKNINKNPKVSVFDNKLKFQTKINFPNIEYRITDVTSVDNNNKFWAINYFYPGDGEKLNPAEDLVITNYGIGKSHISSAPVERLIELEIQEDKIILVNRPPIYLKLKEDESRNWEGLARFNTDGFLIITDTFPETIFGYIKVGE
jgi:hypothetical protein